MKKKIVSSLCFVILAVALTACGEQGAGTSANNIEQKRVTQAADETGEEVEVEDSAVEIPDVTVQFGEGGETFSIHMYDNDTAVELVRSIGEGGRNLPIYNYDNFEGYEYFQYYDIPSRYEIPSNPENISTAKAGEVYYSEPNRVILFYQDAEIAGSYTKVGDIEDITGLKEAVENNPVLEGWGNKLILIRYAN